MLKAERKETGKTISLSVVRDSPRKLTVVLEIRICFKFYFFQFLILQHNWVMNQSIGNSSKFTIDKRASIPLEIFFLLKKKASEIVMVNFIHSPEVVFHTLYLHLCQHQKIVCHVIKTSMAITWHC